jgi:hypothetical protein
MTAQHWYFAAGTIAALVLVIAAVAERRRVRRRDLDATGWVPWQGVQVGAFFALIVILILAFHR